MKDKSETLKELSQYSDDVLGTLRKKTVDYCGANDNISRFGMAGASIRLYDKISRILSLIKLEKNGMLENYEGMDDTIKDIMGYAYILKLLRDGKWETWLQEAGVRDKDTPTPTTTFYSGCFFASPKYTIKEIFAIWRNCRLLFKKDSQVTPCHAVSYISFFQLVCGVIIPPLRKRYIDRMNDITIDTCNACITNELSHKLTSNKVVVAHWV